ncbi:hypothetical protein T06_1939 [Trichinella sp. T6]|nr:hypothetical protein T06_1939 [Trichinella sp. T6]
MHRDGSIVSIGPREKPETVVFYNKTKSGVDHADQLGSVLQYSKKKPTLATGNIFSPIKCFSDKCFRDTLA